MRESSAFYKHIQNEHGGLKQGETFESYFPEVNIVKAYQKVLNRSIEEGTFMINHNGEVLNSKTEWNQPRIIHRTIVQGGAEMVGGRVMPCQRAGFGSGGAGTAPKAPQQPSSRPFFRELQFIQEVLSWLEAECCHSSRLDYRGLGEVMPGPDQSPRKELLSQPEAGLCSSLRMDPRGLWRMMPGPIPSSRKKPTL